MDKLEVAAVTDTDSPYFGEPKVQALQEARDRQAAELSDVPGAVIHARVFSSDDPERLGWSRLREIMAEEGMVTLRGVDEATIERAQRELSEFEPVLHFWDMFMADAKAIRDVCTPLARAPLPAELIRVSDGDINHPLARDVQRFLTEQGVSPFSTDALLGNLFPGKLVVLRHSDGHVAAAGFAAITHNRYSPFAGAAWVGLIGVHPSLRGVGLGKQLDAICNLVAVDELEADATMEFVGRDNMPSRAMLENCGLTNVDGKAVVMFSRSADRITR